MSLPPSYVLRRLGPLRLLLLTAAAICALWVPTPGTLPEFRSWAVVPTLVVPVAVPMVFMVLMLDALMSRVFMIDKQGEQRQIYRIAVALNLLAAAVLVVRWWSYFAALGR